MQRVLNRFFPPKVDEVKPGEKLFISASASVKSGQDAERLIKRKNDTRYLKKDKGIVKVDRRRWHEAQTYEEKTWMVYNSGASDDRNLDHLNGFDGYKAIEGKKFNSAIELGCGPFTNLRLILPKIKVGQIDLLDPLLESYLLHPYCTYKSGELDGYKVKTVAKPIEEFEPTKKYDLVVIINVLEHCFDTDQIFKKILDMLKPGAVLVFEDKLYSAQHIKPQELYDAGHPLRIRQEVIKEFLHSNFKKQYERILVEKSADEPDSIYFIGTKK